MKNISGFVLMLVASSCFAWGGGHGGGGGHAGGGHASAHTSAHAEGEAHSAADTHAIAEESHAAAEDAPAEPMRFSFAPATSHVSGHGASAGTSASDATVSDASTRDDDVSNSDIYLSGLYSLFAAIACWCGLGLFLFMRRTHHG